MGIIIKSKPKELYSIDDDEKPALDRAIKEFNSGEFSVYKSVDELIRDLKE